MRAAVARRFGRRALLLLVATLAATAPGSATAQAQDDDELVVAAFEIEPFVERTGDVPGGFLFEVWEQVAARNGWAYEVVWVDSLDDIADVVEEASADVAVAPLASTSKREARVDFTSPVVASGPVVAVHQRAETRTSLVAALFSRDILRLLAVSGLGLLVLGHLMWLADRRNPESDFSSDYRRGVWDGVWWAMVTVTTVGYGDTAPKTTRSRLVAVLAMLGSLFLVGAFVSEVTTSLQAGRAESVVSSVADLDDRPVAVVASSSYQTYLDDAGATTVAFPTQIEAFEAAERGDVDVVVADRYTVDAVGGDFGLRSSGTVLYDEFIGFAVRGGSELRDPIDATLADLHQEGIVAEIVDRWTN